jgi:hypothetical protein
MYNVFTDKPTTFECGVEVKNATLKNSVARLILESNDINLIFNGKIENNKCIIPIKRLKGFLSENSVGHISLELIIEDTLFKPWTDTFVVEEHTSVKVKVNEQKQPSNKPIVKVKIPSSNHLMEKQVKFPKPTKKTVINVYIPTKEITTLCEQFGIRKSNLHRRKQDLVYLLKEYFKSNKEYNYYRSAILSEINNLLK